MELESARNLAHRSGSDQVSLPIENPRMSICMNDVCCRPEFINCSVKHRISLRLPNFGFCIVFQDRHPAFGPLIGYRPLPVGGSRHSFLVIVSIHSPFFCPGTCNLEIISRLSFRVVILPACRMSGDQFHQPVFPISKVPFSRSCLHQIPFSLVLIIPVNPVADIRTVRLLRHRNILRHIPWVQLIVCRFPVVAQKLEQDTG